MRIRDWAKGHWPKIIAAILGPEYADKKHHPCPGDGEGVDRFRLWDKDGCGNYFCACSEGSRDGFELLQCAKSWSFAEAAQAVEDVIGKCPKDGEESKPRPETWASKLRREVLKTPRSAYLEGRGLEVAPGLDWRKSLPYFGDDGNKSGDWPAMLAPVMRGDEFLTYHVTYLDRGSKAPVNKPRKILPAHVPLEGGACPLYEPDGKLLGIAEGVETAIAAKLIHDVPTWAALNTALLAKWKPPLGIEGVIVFADHDANYAGHSAAYKLAHRLTRMGCEVIVKMPPRAGMDWNDVILQQETAA